MDGTDVASWSPAGLNGAFCLVVQDCATCRPAWTAADVSADTANNGAASALMDITATTVIKVGF